MIKPDNVKPKDFAVVIGLIAWMLACYMIPNKFPLREPYSIPPTVIDQMTPYSVEWIWIYVSYYIYIFGIYLVVSNQETRSRMVYSYLSSSAFSSLIFFAFPTTIPRESPPQLNTNQLSDWAFSFIKSADANLNCLPSMHIAVSVLASLVVRRESKFWGNVGLVWTLLISYSTMATKQHYFLDVVTGAAYGLLFWNLTDQYFKRRIENKIS